MSDSNKKKPLPIINKPSRKKTKKVIVHVSETAFLNILKQVAFIQKNDTVLSGSIKTVEDFIAFHVEHLSKYFSKAKMEINGSISMPALSSKSPQEDSKDQHNMIFEALKFVDQVNKDNPDEEVTKVEEVESNPPALSPGQKLISIKLSEMKGSYISIPKKESEIACLGEEEDLGHEDFISKLVDNMENWTVSDEEIKSGSIQIKDEDPEELFTKKTETYDDDQDFDE